MLRTIRRTLSRGLAPVLGLWLLSCQGPGKGPGVMSSLEDIHDKRIGLVVGTIHDQYAQANFPEAKLVYVDYTPDLAAALENNKCDVFIHNEEAVAYFMKTHPDIGILVKAIRSEDLGFGFNPNNPALRESFNQFLAELRESGQLAAICRKWREDFDNTPAPELTGDGSGGVLHFGTSGVDIPCSSIKDGRPAGYDVEILYRFASKHNMKVDLQRIPFGGLIAALSSGKVDVIANGMVITPERSKQVAFSDTYLTKTIDVAALKKNIAAYQKPAGKNFRSVDDIGQSRIGVWTGSVYDKYTAEHFPEAQVVYIDASPDLVVSLVNEKCDVFMIHSELAAHFLAQYPEVGLLQQYPDTDTLGYGFNLRNTALRDSFDAFLARTGYDTLQAICDKWAHGFNDTPPPALGGTGKKGVLRLGTTGTDVPCSSTKDGKPAGYDIEIVYRYAAEHDLRVEVDKMPFSALIASLSSGKTDLIGSGVMITPERQKQILFSTPYRTRSLCFLALKKNIAAYNDVTGAAKQPGKKFKNADDVAKRHVGVLIGSLHDIYATKHLPKAKFFRSPGPVELVTALQSHKVDAILLNDVSTRFYRQKHPEIGILQEHFCEDSIAFGFSYQNPALREKFNRFLSGLKESGELDRILDKWYYDFDNTPPPTFTGEGSAGVLRIGNTGQDLPYTVIKENRPAGSEIEILYRFAEAENLRPQIVQMDFGALIPSLQTGKVDVIASSLGMTPERSKEVAFSHSYQRIPVHVLALSENILSGKKDGFRNLDDVREKTIAVLMGSTHDQFVRDSLPKAQPLRLDAIPDLIVALQARKADAALMVAKAGRLYLKQYPELAVLDENVFTENVAAGFNYNNPALLKQFNAFLERTRQSGELDEIQRKWEEDFDNQPPPAFTGKSGQGTLRIGTTGMSAPYSVIKEGLPAGSDVEILYRFASEQNLTPQVQYMAFGSLLSALQSGKVDVIVNSIAITPERAKQVAFSEPYQRLAVYMLTLKSSLASDGSAEEAAVAHPRKGLWAGIKEGFQNNLIAEKRYTLILKGLRTTLVITLCSVLFGTFLGALICFWRMSRRRFWRAVGNTYLSILSGTPVLVFLMIMFYVVFAKVPVSPTVVATIALAMAFGAFVSSIYKTSIETIPPGQTEAGIAMGFTPVQTFLHIVMPQAVRVALPLYKGEVISMLKTTAIVGYIAVEDLTKAGDIIRSRTFDAFFPLIMVALIYFALARLMAIGLDRLARRTDPRYRQMKEEKRTAKNLAR